MGQAGKIFIKPDIRIRPRGAMRRAADMGAVIMPLARRWVARLAGANWDNGSHCGSRARNANNTLSHSNATVGGQAAIPVKFVELHRAERLSLVNIMTRIYNATHPLSVAMANARGAEL